MASRPFLLVFIPTGASQVSRFDFHLGLFRDFILDRPWHGLVLQERGLMESAALRHGAEDSGIPVEFRFRNLGDNFLWLGHA